ncbi:cyclopropane-fatty-acyl-phospholipid synthase family protein [Coralliovum pocilloporae]|uniref:cyclopropane-fatty-acyl-phospholipid synthase family protein n=1 Tax=Coralliovum pocilloporae TaxID=3066369 RepID=UPI003307B8BA
MNRLLFSFLNRIIVKGSLTVIDCAGQSFHFGEVQSKQTVTIRLTNRTTEWKLIADPEREAGEAYMDGRLLVEQGSLYDFLALAIANMEAAKRPWWMATLSRLRVWTRRFRQNNTRKRAQQNVAHHYDLSGALYDLFLDTDKQYSCGYFEDSTSTLEDAQLAKKRHLAAKLHIQPNQTVLDIGSGWGGLSLYLAQNYPVSVTGVTLSEEQFDISRCRAKTQNLRDRVDFRFRDYRKLEQKFDRIVSVGMFEHVGIGHFPEFFNMCHNLLADDGVMVLHSIGRLDGPGETNPWIRKYIFPGGYMPALSEVLPVLERSGLKVTDVEILRLHYADTLRAWRNRFMARWDEAAMLYDERFCRMWEFYLAACETAFRYQDLMVFQIQMVKDQTVLPMTRAYMQDEEDRLRQQDGDKPRFGVACE